MKIIKLIFIFVIICGIVVGAFFLIQDSDDVKIGPINPNIYQHYRDEIISKWEQVDDWNDSLFISQSNLANQLDDNSLKDLNSKKAAEIVFIRACKEWGSPTCRKHLIKRYIDAVPVIIADDSNASADQNIILVKEINKVYESADNLAHQTIGISPRFDGSSWNSYNAYNNSILTKRDNILKNDKYKKYLSNIIDIKNGLNAIPDKLSNARNTFYNALANKIVWYFGAIESSERTRTDLNKLRNIISRYEDEFSSNSTLSKFASEFGNDVNNNENAKN